VPAETRLNLAHTRTPVEVRVLVSKGKRGSLSDCGVDNITLADELEKSGKNREKVRKPPLRIVLRWPEDSLPNLPNNLRRRGVGLS
jgi:hypothetical protein